MWLSRVLFSQLIGFCAKWALIRASWTCIPAAVRVVPRSWIVVPSAGGAAHVSVTIVRDAGAAVRGSATGARRGWLGNEPTLTPVPFSAGRGGGSGGHHATTRVLLITAAADAARGEESQGRLTTGVAHTLVLILPDSEVKCHSGSWDFFRMALMAEPASLGHDCYLCC